MISIASVMNHDLKQKIWKEIKWSLFGSLRDRWSYTMIYRVFFYVSLFCLIFFSITILKRRSSTWPFTSTTKAIKFTGRRSTWSSCSRSCRAFCSAFSGRRVSCCSARSEALVSIWSPIYLLCLVRGFDFIWFDLRFMIVLLFF